MAEVIDIRREPADFPCGSWWANAALALPAAVFFAECCPLHFGAGATAETPAAIVHRDASAPSAPPEAFLIELVETWTTSRVVRVGSDGACQIVYEGAKRRGPWHAIAFQGEAPVAAPAQPAADALDELIANTERLPLVPPAPEEHAPLP